MPDHGVEWDGKTTKDESINFAIEGLVIDELPGGPHSQQDQKAVSSVARVAPRQLSIALKTNDTGLVAAALLEYAWNQKFPLEPVEREGSIVWFGESSMGSTPVYVNTQRLEPVAYTSISGIKVRRVESL